VREEFRVRVSSFKAKNKVKSKDKSNYLTLAKGRLGWGTR